MPVLSSLSTFAPARYFHEARWRPTGWPLAGEAVLVRVSDEQPMPSQAASELLGVWLEANHQALRAAVLCHLFEELARNADWFDIDDRDLSACVQAPEDLLAEIALREIRVHGMTSTAEPVLGLVFDCTWDDEHGLGVLACGVRCLRSAAADIAHCESAASACTPGLDLHGLP